jgi:predicted RNA-binding Zn ribbon-like protein
VSVVRLDPGGYAGSYKLIGGASSLDFANLVSYRDTDRHHDWLGPAGNLERWAEATGVTERTVADLEEIRAFRELLARVFLAVADDETPASNDIDTLGAMVAAANLRRRLRFPDGSDAAVWVPAGTSLEDELALDAVAILTSPARLRRVSACAECRWVFLDTTRTHSRRWCDPADCGNRARQRRHYYRERT